MNIKMSSLSIRLKFTGQEFEVCAKIVFDKPRREIDFILNQNLMLTKFASEDNNLSLELLQTVQPEFRSTSNQWKICCEEEISVVYLEYSGTVEFWYNVLAKDVKALSWYSVWFPQELPFELAGDEVIIEDGADLFVVKGEFDGGTGTWRYGGNGFDPFNIVAYQKSTLTIVANENLNIYTVDAEIANQAEKIDKVYQDILNYFNGELFVKKAINTLDIATVYPAIKQGGGYQRTGLLFTDKLGDSDEEISWLIAHETAHNWCTGADVNSFEDWLNEGTADWSALLYALSVNNQKLFDFIINMRKSYADFSQPLKPIDGSRCPSVHANSTMLLYQIYEKYGSQYVEQIIRMFAELKVKTTENLLNKISNEISDDIASDLLKGLR